MKKITLLSVLFCAVLGAGVWGQSGWTEEPAFFGREMNGRFSGPVFSPDERRLAAVFHNPDGRDRNKINRMIVLWDAASGREIRRLPGHNGIGIYSLAYSPDGKRLISGAMDGTVIVWNTETGEKMWNKTTPERISQSAYSPDGNRIAVILPGDDGYSIKIWDAASGAEIRSLSGDGAVIRSLTYSPDGRRIAASVAGNIKIWDAGTGRELRTINVGSYNASFSRDGNLILTLPDSINTAEGETICSWAEVWDAGTGRRRLAVGYGPLNAGARAYADLQVARFLGDTAAAGQHEGILQFITGRGNATRAEIEAYYRQNIGALIAGVVDEEAKETSIPTATLADMKQRISAFYLSPNQTTFNALKDFYSRINLEYTVLQMIGIYNNSSGKAEVYEKYGMTEAAASQRELGRTSQQKLIPVARTRNMTFEQFAAFPWSDVGTVFSGSLDELSPALANRVTR